MSFKDKDYQMGIQADAQQYAFYFDGTRCSGCKVCEIACKDYYHLPADRSYRHVYEYTGGTWTELADGSFEQSVFNYPVSISCNHCDKPACVEACPSGAMHKNEQNFVLVHEEQCIACGSCEKACPYHAPRMNTKDQHMEKCSGCYERIKQGRSPICVEACTMRALQFAPIEEIMKLEGEEANIAPLPDPALTTPSLIIKASPLAKASGDTSGFIGNIAEV